MSNTEMSYIDKDFSLHGTGRYRVQSRQAMQYLGPNAAPCVLYHVKKH